MTCDCCNQTSQTRDTKQQRNDPCTVKLFLPIADIVIYTEIILKKQEGPVYFGSNFKLKKKQHPAKYDTRK